MQLSHFLLYTVAAFLAVRSLVNLITSHKREHIRHRLDDAIQERQAAAVEQLRLDEQAAQEPAELPSREVENIAA